MIPKDRREILLMEIKKRLSPLKPYKIIVFGSAITDNFHEESDIDIVVILNRKGITKSYSERLKNRNHISKVLRDLRKKMPIDLFVYTKDEWNMLLESGSAFHREIEKKGRNIA